jgi:uncharacterized protein YceK
MKFLKTVLVVLLVSTLLIGCYTIKYQMGSGPQTGQVATAKQWYVLWGLVPINHVDVPTMIGNTTNYQYRSQLTFVDCVINCITGSVSVYCQTVEVKK